MSRREVQEEAGQGRVDPLIEEVRALRRGLQQRCGGDLEGLVRHLRELEKEYPDRVVDLEPRIVAERPDTSI